MGVTSFQNVMGPGTYVEAGQSVDAAVKRVVKMLYKCLCYVVCAHFVWNAGLMLYQLVRMEVWFWSLFPSAVLVLGCAVG
jgi:hypothetical protein